MVPRHLVDAVAAAKVAADRGSPVIDQLAFADFLTRGEFDRHLRRMRPVYRRRRDALRPPCGSGCPTSNRPASRRACTSSPGCRPGRGQVVAAAARRGLGVYGVGPYRLARTGPGGLIFGYATLGERTIDEGIGLLAAVLDEVRSR